MEASLVYDGKTFNIPSSMGTPTENQLKGTPAEQLGELSSRICYDSLGYDASGKPRGRSSVKLHEHILEVKNHSVYEHYNFTVGLIFDSYYKLLQASRSFFNRKGIWLEFVDENTLEVTLNLRVLLEWNRNSNSSNKSDFTDSLYDVLMHSAKSIAPLLIKYPVFGESYLQTNRDLLLTGWNTIGETYIKIDPLNENQAWVSMYLYGSRGFSHEQVRHRFAMSQRSTRYVDESQSDYIEHPLISKYLLDDSVGQANMMKMVSLIHRSVDADRLTYNCCVSLLEQYLLKAGLDKQTARKQARGASRGYLGNALATEMIFSAPVSGWKWILSQRANKAADAEIRQIYCDVLPALQASQYSHFFKDYTLVDSPDGIGKVLQ